MTVIKLITDGNHKPRNKRAISIVANVGNDTDGRKITSTAANDTASHNDLKPIKS